MRTGCPGGQFGILRKHLYLIHQVSRQLASEATLKKRCFFGIGGLPGGKSLIPSSTTGDLPLLMLRKISPNLVRHKESFLGQTQSLTSRLGELGPTLTVSCRGSLDFGNSFADNCLDLDEGRLSVRIGASASKGSGNRFHIMPVFQALNLKTIGCETIQDTFALSG